MGIVRVWDTYWRDDRRLEAVIELEGDQHGMADAVERALEGAAPGVSDVVRRVVDVCCSRLGCHVGERDRLAARVRLPSLDDVVASAPLSGPTIWLTSATMSDACLRAEPSEVSDVVIERKPAVAR